MVAENLSTTLPADRVLVLTRTLAAPRKLVFQAWSQPEHLVRWFGPKGFTLPFCEVDFRPSGAYRFCMRSPDGVDHWVSGFYREIVEPERIVFTWEREDPRRESVVTLTFAERDGGTLLTLHHAEFTTIADRDSHRGGWTECLDRLAALLAQECVL
jgi:uncharacterized protein YndB with AHSA1/START domain